MNEKLLARILKKVGDPELLDKLVNRLSSSDFHSLMLEIYNGKANRISPSELFENYQINRFVKPAHASVEIMRAFDHSAFAKAKEIGFESIELSPIAPLGNCSVIGTVHQNKIISANRSTEVVADSTNLMALEGAKRRKDILKIHPKSKEQIKLCCSHRVVRAQALKDPSHFPHFRLFTCITAGSDEGAFRFEITSLKTHLAFYLKLLTQVHSEFQFENIKVLITELDLDKKKPSIEKEIFHPLQQKFPQVSFQIDNTREGGRNYYQNWCFKINMTNQRGIEFPLIDGGFTNWTQQLINNQKERLLISAIGSELACLHFYNPS